MKQLTEDQLNNLLDANAALLKNQKRLLYFMKTLYESGYYIDSVLEMLLREFGEIE